MTFVPLSGGENPHMHDFDRQSQEVQSLVSRQGINSQLFVPKSKYDPIFHFPPCVWEPKWNNMPIWHTYSTYIKCDKVWSVPLLYLPWTSMNLSLSTELYGTIVHRCDSGATIRLVDVSDVIVQILHDLACRPSIAPWGRTPISWEEWLEECSRFCCPLCIGKNGENKKH